jgi:hypothetical protein
MATVPREAGGQVALLGEAIGLIASRRLLLPVAALTLLLTVSNIFVAVNVPPEGQRPGVGFAIAAFIRIAGLLLLAVAILRLMTDSARRALAPDAGFWLYVLTFLAVTAFSVAVRLATGAVESLASITLVNAITAVLAAPFAVWFIALAVERPVPWSPRPWLANLGIWLPGFLLWTLVLVTPMAVLHAFIDMSVLSTARDWFWPLLLFDGPLSALMAVISMGLGSAAYRRVARR